MKKWLSLFFEANSKGNWMPFCLKVCCGLLFAFLMSAQGRSLGAESDSGISGPSYSELVKYFSSLPQKYPGIIEVNQYGQTPKGRPLVMLKVAYPKRFVIPRSTGAAILITGATHGNEYLGIEDKLPEWFASVGINDPQLISYFKTGGVIYFIPIFNPDGYEARRRENSRGIDLNRDFSVMQAKFEGFKEVETQAARNMIQNLLQINQQRLLLTMDYHCCIGAALYPWSFRSAPELPQNHLSILTALGNVMKITFGSDFRVGTTPKVLGYSAVGTSKDYYYEKYGSMSFTYEGEEDIEKNKFPQHIQMWKNLIQTVQANRSYLNSVLQR